MVSPERHGAALRFPDVGNLVTLVTGRRFLYAQLVSVETLIPILILATYFGMLITERIRPAREFPSTPWCCSLPAVNVYCRSARSAFSVDSAGNLWRNSLKLANIKIFSGQRPQPNRPRSI